MSYCSNCGGRINDNGICPNCGSVSEAKIQPEQKRSSEAIVCLKSFFSKRPLLAIENAARTKAASVWITFGIIFIISSVIFALRIITSIDSKMAAILFNEQISSAFAAANAEISSKMLSALLSLILNSMILSAFALIISALITMIMFLLAEERPSFFQALNIAAVSAFPFSLCMIAAFVMSFFSFVPAVILLAVGLASSSVSYYFGIQKASAFKTSPFWAFLAATLVGGIVLELISMALTKLIF